MKEEDLDQLARWQRDNSVPIHIWHVLYDAAFGIAFDRARQLIDDRLIEPTTQTFHAPSGATTTKTIYKIYYHHAYKVAVSISEPTLHARFLEDRNGHILPYVTFSGGELRIEADARETLAILKSKV